MRSLIKDFLPRNQAMRLREVALHSKFVPTKIDLSPKEKDVLSTDYRKSATSTKNLNQSTANFIETRFLELIGQTASRVYFPNVWEIFRYSQGSYFKSHSDAYDEVAGELVITHKRAFSFVICLSDPSEFTGGQFRFTYDNEVVDMGLGDALMFSSDSLDNNHEVTELISGTRLTLVNWAHWKG
jgi:predicted 2-oxoglutarate/Fe(II)-dependent dioxygenase YbiX